MPYRRIVGTLVTRNGGQRLRTPGFVAIAALLCWLATPHSALGFTACTTTPLESARSKLPMEQEDPIAIGRNVYLTYVTGRVLTFQVSNDGGRHFTSQRLDDGKDNFVNRPRVAAYGPNVFIVWVSSTAGTGRLVFRKSGDYGANFGPQTVLSAAFSSDAPQIAASALGVTIAFVNSADRVVLASSADGGETWPFMKTGLIAGQTKEETVGRLGKNIVASWSEWGRTANYSFVGASTDGGATFHVKKLSRLSRGARERQVTVSTTTGIWYIYAIDQSHGTPARKMGGDGVLFTSTDKGSSWTEQKFDDNTNNQWILADGNDVYLTWLQYLPDGPHVELSYSVDNGVTWKKTRDLSGPIGVPLPLPDESLRPAMSIFGQRFSEVYVSQGDVIVRSTDDITKNLSAPVTLGPGSNGVIAGGNVLWLGPGTGEDQAVFYGRCN
jgi:hypothetical protein